MTITTRHLILGLALSALGTGCSETEIFIPNQLLETVTDNRTSIEGSFCAEGADALQSFLKIMFIVDRSNSMNVTDPNGQRVTAAQDVVLRFVDDQASLSIRDGVEFAVLSFFGNVVVHTRDERGLPGFTSDGALTLGSLAQLGQTGANTNYTGALAEALIVLDRDMAQLDEEARGRTRYEIIFVSDGMPFPDQCRGEGNSPTAAVEAVRRIRGLSTLYGTDVSFNTAFASDPRMFSPGSDVDFQCEEPDPFELNFNESLGQETRALLDNMAAVGDGTFKQFANGDAINFLAFEFAESRRIFALSNFIASNINARPFVDQMTPDSDGDGLTDEEEIILGTSPVRLDSDLDGYRDLIEFRFRLSGFDPLDPTDANCDERGRLDTDGDGLLDCEEQFLGTQRRRLDSDNDGIPDLLEVTFGADPNSATPVQDRQSDSDADGGSNADEMRWHTDPNNDDVAFRSKIAYDYYQRELPLTDGQACYEFRVRNVRLASTQRQSQLEDPEGNGRGPGWNRTLLYFAQTPYDDPLGDPIYRVACVESRFLAGQDIKIPASGEFSIPQRRPSDTYEATGVLRPNDQVCQASVNQDCGLNTLWCRVEPTGACNCYEPPRDADDPADGRDEDDDGEPDTQPCPECSDGIDNDGDGLTDFPFDPDCFDTLDTQELENEACSNGRDDDGDNLVDWPNDPGCASGYDTDEDAVNPVTQCSDGVDNDGDGAADFPLDGGCDSAADDSEDVNPTAPEPACDDGEDNDGDGLIDLADAGCFDANDVDESGPQTCFFCELFSDIRPGQCDISAGYCRPRSGAVPDAAAADGTRACTNNEDCRGGVCRDGSCGPCLQDRDCNELDAMGNVVNEGICDEQKGWCLFAPERSAPLLCTSDAQCQAEGRGSCDVEVGRCTADPYYACGSDRNCGPEQVCDEDTGFCLEPIFETSPCDDDTPCAEGACDDDLGYCLPDQEDVQCQTDDQCPFGVCSARGFCDQASFVPPLRFDPSKDCIRAR